MWLKVLNLATGRLMSKTAIECLETSHLSGLFSYGDLIVKLFIKNLCFLQILETITHQKLKKVTVNYESTTNQINVYWRFFFSKKNQKVHHTNCNWKLVISYSIPSQGKFLHPLKCYLAQKFHSQLFSTFPFNSVIITQLLSAGLNEKYT